MELPELKRPIIDKERNEMDKGEERSGLEFVGCSEDITMTSITSTEAEPLDPKRMLARIAFLEDENRRLQQKASSSEKEVENLQFFWPRLGWLVGLLLFQSLSSFVLQSFHNVTDEHKTIMFFLTMLVGAGGNVGGQSVVLVVRAIATKRQVPSQTVVGLKLAFFLSIVTLGRTLIQGVEKRVVIAATISMFFIVATAAALGQLLPNCFRYVGIDPAHSSATIQVLMDILGVTFTCIVITIVVMISGHQEGGFLSA